MSRIFLSPPWTGEREKQWLAKAFESGYVAPCGPMVDEFEKRLFEISGMNAAAVTSGTAAIDLLMHELNIGKGDIVITSSLTFIATIAPAFHRGAIPVFIDTDPATGTMDITLLQEALESFSNRAKCIVAADIYGQCSDYDALEELSARYNVPLILDAAESFGGKWKNRFAGFAGVAGIYSFNGNKIITTSGGGAVVSRNPEIVSRAKWRSSQSRENVLWYEHREAGYNYRLSNLLGAVGLGQLDALEEIKLKKLKIFETYKTALEGLAQPFPCSEHTQSTHWLSVFLFESERKRDAVANNLAKHNIESRPVWKPLHAQPVFVNNNGGIFGGKVSDDLFSRGICLPSGAGLSDAEQELVISLMLEK